MHRRRLRHQIAVWLFVACAPGLASADWPVGPITLVLGAPEGSELDKVARVLAPALERRLGTPIALDYRDGAQGSTASAYVATVRPDGYTMALLSDPAVSAANLATVENIGRLALIAPKGVSLEILERVGSAVREVLQHSIIREKLTGLGFALRDGAVEQSQATVETTRTEKVTAPSVSAVPTSTGPPAMSPLPSPAWRSKKARVPKQHAPLARSPLAPVPSAN